MVRPSAYVEIQTLTTGNGSGDIFINDAFTWNSANKLTLTAYRDININQHIDAAGGASIKLRADSTGLGSGMVTFGSNGRVIANNGASVGIYYNPTSYTDAATRSDTTGNPYSGKVTRSGGATLTAYMLVSNVSQLQAMKDRPSGFYALGRDIDAGATAGWNGGKGFIPVGTANQTFSGRFFGDDHVIRNLYINDPSLSIAAGLFGAIGGFGVVSHVGLTGVTITAGGNVGMLAGQNFGNITKAYATGNVIGRGAGGLTGLNAGSITQAFSTGTVMGLDGGSAGGLAGYNSGVITNSFSTSAVSLTFTSCGVLCTQGAIGGLVASNNGTLTNTYATGLLTIYGSVSSGSNGLFGAGFSTTTSSFWNMETTGQSGSPGGTGKTTAQMKQQATFSGWDFTNIWRINEGSSYPYLAWTEGGVSPATTLLSPLGSTSTVGNSIGPTKKPAADICSVAPVVCRPEIAPIPPRPMEKPVPNSVNLVGAVTDFGKNSNELMNDILSLRIKPDENVSLVLGTTATLLFNTLSRSEFARLFNITDAKNKFKTALMEVLKEEFRKNPSKMNLSADMLKSLLLDRIFDKYKGMLMDSVNPNAIKNSYPSVTGELLTGLTTGLIDTAFIAMKSGLTAGWESKGNPAAFYVLYQAEMAKDLTSNAVNQVIKVGVEVGKLNVEKSNFYAVVMDSYDSVQHIADVGIEASHLASATGDMKAQTKAASMLSSAKASKEAIATQFAESNSLSFSEARTLLNLAESIKKGAQPKLSATGGTTESEKLFNGFIHSGPGGGLPSLKVRESLLDLLKTIMPAENVYQVRRAMGMGI